MGTRNLTIVKVGGKTKIAQYGQWDGYPTGQGETVADFIQNHLDLKVFKKKVSSLKSATDKYVKKTWVEAGADPDSTMVSCTIADKHDKIYPEFSRDTCAKILRLVQDGVLEQRDYIKRNDEMVDITINKTGYDVTHVALNRSFLKDSCCEYAYELDLDKKTVTVYVSGDKFNTYKFADFTPDFMPLLANQIENKFEEEYNESAKVSK